MSSDDELMNFADEAPQPPREEPDSAVWRVLIIDDEKDVHSATTFALRNIEILGRPLSFLHAANAREAKRILCDVGDIAVILLDVVMETPNAGLDLVAVIRNELGIKDSRIILRTGQPNQAPEIEVIRDYDINEYKLKSELTQARLYASLTTAIRSYKQIRTIEAGKQSLKMIVHASAELLTQQGLREFAEGVIVHLSGLLSIAPEGLICVRRREGADQVAQIIAAAGKYTSLIDQPLDSLQEVDARDALLACLTHKKHSYLEGAMALYLGSEERGAMACFVHSNVPLADLDNQLLELFCHNISICADNLELVARLSQFAYCDVLSGLRNRNALVDAVNAVIGQRGDHLLALVDIDNFAEINASLGQQYGDSLLRAVGHRLEQYFPQPCLVARVSGDTFAVFGPAGSLHRERLMEPFVQPFQLGDQEQIISVTAGLVPLAEVDGGGDEAVKDATIVLKSAKNTSRGEALLFKRDMVRDAHDRLGMLRHLRAAFEMRQLHLAYQPKFRLSDGAVIGFEALLRWRDQHDNLISPAQFIPLAEQSGLIVRMGRWVLEEALRTLAELHRLGWNQCHMSVNLSVAQLLHRDVLAMLREVIGDCPVAARHVDLEITESMAVADMDSTLKLLSDIKALGFTLSLDDFGTGFSSLNHLQRMPIDHLKLDRSLIAATASSSGEDIVETIVQLAERLQMTVIAEGVEKRSELDFLRRVNCAQIQGFYYAKPMIKSELLAWLASRK